MQTLTALPTHSTVLRILQMLDEHDALEAQPSSAQDSQATPFTTWRSRPSFMTWDSWRFPEASLLPPDVSTSGPMKLSNAIHDWRPNGWNRFGSSDAPP